jgi:hypothetical protein
LPARRQKQLQRPRPTLPLERQSSREVLAAAVGVTEPRDLTQTPPLVSIERRRIRCLLDFGKRQRMPRTKALTRRRRPGQALRHARDRAERLTTRSRASRSARQLSGVETSEAVVCGNAQGRRSGCPCSRATRVAAWRSASCAGPGRPSGRWTCGSRPGPRGVRAVARGACGVTFV